MNEIIAKKLDDQLRVLGIFLNDYQNELPNIIGSAMLNELKDDVMVTRSNIHTFLTK